MIFKGKILDMLGQCGIAYLFVFLKKKVSNFDLKDMEKRPLSIFHTKCNFLLIFISKLNHLAISFEQSEISFFHDKSLKNLRFVAKSSLLKADN
jgi:hypothetical protein